jgi:hypothetical protein
MKLPFQDTINAAGLLFFPQLQPIFRLFFAALSVLARGVSSPAYRTLIRITAVTFQKKLDTFAPAKPAGRIGISCQITTSSIK